MISKTKSMMYSFKIGDQLETTLEYEKARTIGDKNPVTLNYHIEGKVVGIKPLDEEIFDLIHLQDHESNTHMLAETNLRTPPPAPGSEE